MSEVIDSYDDEIGDQAPKDPVRARMRQLEKELKAKEQELAEAAAVKRELAFVKAGVPLDNPATKYFVKAYDGDLTPEAIRAAAEEANFIQKQAQEAQAKSEQDAWSRLQRASRAGESSEPVSDWASKINNARNQEEVMQILAQVRQEAETL